MSSINTIKEQVERARKAELQKINFEVQGTDFVVRFFGDEVTRFKLNLNVDDIRIFEASTDDAIELLGHFGDTTRLADESMIIIKEIIETYSEALQVFQGVELGK